jgi:quinol monooxygenase YgiN
MTVIVTVRFTGDPERADAVLREHPNIADAVRKAAADHGLIRSTRYVRDGEFLEIDEWEREEDRNGFLADAGPYLKRWNEFAGISDMQSTVWHLAQPVDVV